MSDFWNDEPPVNAKNWLHFALIGLHAVERLPNALVALLILATSAAVGMLWARWSPTMAWIVALIQSAFIGLDWFWLAWLPHKQISFGPVKPPLLGLIGVRTTIGLMALVGLWFGVPAWAMLTVIVLIHLLADAAIIYATAIEPFRLGITYLKLHTHKLPANAHLRLVQISDLHVERVTRREKALIEQVNALNADCILLTGDYLNFSYIGEPQAMAECRRVLGQLRAGSGIYAVRGTHQVDPNAIVQALFDGLPIRWLRNEHLCVGQDGRRIVLAGASATREPQIDIPAVERALADTPRDLFTVLLFHTPERVAEAQRGGADLYLAGHTHGGQIRLPLIGALITASDAGKKYEMGRYDLNGMILYVNRGIGMEGKGAPRARFLCPPEIVCIDLYGGAS